MRGHLLKHHGKCATCLLNHWRWSKCLTRRNAWRRWNGLFFCIFCFCFFCFSSEVGYNEHTWVIAALRSTAPRSQNFHQWSDSWSHERHSKVHWYHLLSTNWYSRLSSWHRSGLTWMSRLYPIWSCFFNYVSKTKKIASPRNLLPCMVFILAEE